MAGYASEHVQVGRNRRTRWGVLAGLLVLAAAAAALGPGLRRNSSDGANGDSIAQFLLAVAVILFVSHLLATPLRRWHQPPVLGELLGGVLLGPSALGLLWPAGEDWLFHPDVLSNLDRAAQLGLVTFMFLLGCELRMDSVRNRRTVGVVAGSMGLPFVVGVGIALAAGEMLGGPSANALASALFFGLAMSITALPVLARILVDLRLDGSPLGATALSAAAIGDGLAWTVLAVILATISPGANGRIATTTGLAVTLVLVTVLCVRPALATLVRWMSQRHGHEHSLLAVLAVGAMGFAAFSTLIGLHAVIGAFLFGTAAPRRSAAVKQISEQLQGFAVAILLPLFFAGVGLSTSILLLGGDPVHWLLFAGVLLASIGTKFLGAGGAARLAGMPGDEALQLSTLMNCRGVTELVVATVGLQYHLVSPLGFTILVLVAMITTAGTAPLMRRWPSRITGP